jgi:hypothetical protein
MFDVFLCCFLIDIQLHYCIIIVTDVAFFKFYIQLYVQLNHFQDGLRLLINLISQQLLGLTTFSGSRFIDSSQKLL